jgi:hypothetical protein
MWGVVDSAREPPIMASAAAESVREPIMIIGCGSSF